MGRAGPRWGRGTGSGLGGWRRWGCRRLVTLPPLPQHFAPTSVSMAAAWRPATASVHKPGEVTTAPAVSGRWPRDPDTASSPARACLRPRAVTHQNPAAASRLPQRERAGFGPKSPTGVHADRGQRRVDWGLWVEALGDPLPFPRLTACAPGVWGPQCDRPCSCGNGSSCDPKSGECSCPPGLQPPHCLKPCSPGRYGPACQFSCHCHGAPCDPRTGACFCPPERTGPRCVTGTSTLTGPHTQDHTGAWGDSDGAPDVGVASSGQDPESPLRSPAGGREPDADGSCFPSV